VWYYDLDDPPPADGGSCLDPAERERAARFYRERDGLRFRAAHCAFRHLVAGYLGCDPAAVTITRECAHCGDPRHGKPMVAGLIEVNASHSDALGALAVALPPLRLGMDVERHRPNVNWAGILPDPAAAEPPNDGFEQWTRLEAVAKAAGTGIVRMPRLSAPGPDGWAPAAFPTNPDGPAGPDSPAGPAGSHGPARLPAGGPDWRVRSLAPPEGYAAALAVSSVPAAGVAVHWYR
jgi:4'-phosphopantetheinyl transferase